MALSAKLTMRQGQTMVLTPQLLAGDQAPANAQPRADPFIENELTSNPLLERAEEREDPHAEPADEATASPSAGAEPGDWAAEALETDAGGLAANLGTEVDNAFDSDRSAPAVNPPRTKA